MLQIAAILFFCGAVFLCLDINIEGFGPLAATGLLFVVAAAVMTIVSAPVFGVYIVLGGFILLGLAVFVSYQIFKRSKLKKRIILEDALNEDEDDKAFLSEYVGKNGVARTTLRPCGFVSFGGSGAEGQTDIEAYSDGPYITENTPVTAVRVHERKLYVRALPQG